MDYREAGVDVQAGRDFVQTIRRSIETTYRKEVIGGIGGFGGYFEIPQGYRQPVLVSSTDGVGTKLKLANVLNCHNTVGIDLVAMCVNDILTSGAEPLFFLDYLATGKLDNAQLAEVVEGIVIGCRESGCTLLGGETAEMPGFYPSGEYDMAGFCVGIVEKSKLLDGSLVAIGDIAIGLASTGVHSNGFSLVRKVIEEKGLSWDLCVEEHKTLAQVLLTPTRIYVKPVLDALRKGIRIHGMAHITGGGIPENLPRCLNSEQSVRVDTSSWPVPKIFALLGDVGEISPTNLYETFNMGLGYILIVPPSQVEEALDWFNLLSINAYVVGEVVAGKGEVLGI